MVYDNVHQMSYLDMLTVKISGTTGEFRRRVGIGTYRVVMDCDSVLWTAQLHRWRWS